MAGLAGRASATFDGKRERFHDNHPESLGDVRGRGLMIGLELSPNENGENLAFELALLCERRGVHITYSYYEPVIRFIPPLVISKPEIEVSSRSS